MRGSASSTPVSGRTSRAVSSPGVRLARCHPRTSRPGRRGVCSSGDLAVAGSLSLASDRRRRRRDRRGPGSRRGDRGAPAASVSRTPSETPTPAPTRPRRRFRGADRRHRFDRTAHSLDDPNSIWVVVNKLRPMNPQDFEPDRPRRRSRRRTLDAADAPGGIRRDRRDVPGRIRRGRPRARLEQRVPLYSPQETSTTATTASPHAPVQRAPDRPRHGHRRRQRRLLARAPVSPTRPRASGCATTPGGSASSCATRPTRPPSPATSSSRGTTATSACRSRPRCTTPASRRLEEFFGLPPARLPVSTMAEQ